jgi:hypothetical protein
MQQPRLALEVGHPCYPDVMRKRTPQERPANVTAKLRLLHEDEIRRVTGGWTDGSVWPVGTVATGSNR